MWTDTTECLGISTIATGYVIKHGNMAPFIGSTIYNDRYPFEILIPDDEDPDTIHSVKYYNLHNSKGEMVAALEGMDTLLNYCEDRGLDPGEYTVNLKTDFQFLRTVISNNINVKKIPQIDGKQVLLGEIKNVQGQFHRVNCELIEGSTNIAHNICGLKMKDYMEKEVNTIVEQVGEAIELNRRESVTERSGLKSDFYEIYKNPSLSIPQ
jgi:hypothetical protein